VSPNFFSSVFATLAMPSGENIFSFRNCSNGSPLTFSMITPAMT